MSDLPHQDLTPLVLRKRPDQIRAPDGSTARSASVPHPTHVRTVRVETDEDGEEKVVAPVAQSLELRQALARARQAKNMTQQELAQRISIPRAEIANIESGKTPLTSARLVQLNRVLGTSLRLA